MPWRFFENPKVAMDMGNVELSVQPQAMDMSRNETTKSHNDSHKADSVSQNADPMPLLSYVPRWISSQMLDNSPNSSADPNMSTAIWMLELLVFLLMEKVKELLLKMIFLRKHPFFQSYQCIKLKKILKLLKLKYSDNNNLI